MNQVTGVQYYGEPLATNAVKLMRVNGYYEADDIGMGAYKIEHNGSSQFEAKISSQNNGIKLRRLSDQANARQRARVYIDNVLVKERDWFHADHNTAKIFLDDDFEIPAAYTHGKDKVTIRIEYLSSEKGTWSEIIYSVFSYK